MNVFAIKKFEFAIKLPSFPDHGLVLMRLQQ